MTSGTKKGGASTKPERRPHNCYDLFGSPRLFVVLCHVNRLFEFHVTGSKGHGIWPIVRRRLKLDILVHSKVQVWLVGYKKWGHLIF